ncbi:hypothetical protein PABY_15860 [Pyrodictium abyssi]|uniref:Deoxyuridine 5'-triphosphate nucleotidohydrolase n=1 Tax=Pyrodictium abyssi TaxID=54256 RepID=A0ABM8IWW1_9CREN|nr:hypothetical protein PABY_15860 [Pyrodictium abyssi]
MGEVHVFRESGYLGAEGRRIPASEPLEPEGGAWLLSPGFYKAVFMDAVHIPENTVATCFPRSSLLRMGALLGCAVWDPGYRGRGEALLVVGNPHGIRIEVGARIAQLVFIRLYPQLGERYSGVYQGERLAREQV